MLNDHLIKQTELIRFASSKNPGVLYSTNTRKFMQHFHMWCELADPIHPNTVSSYSTDTRKFMKFMIFRCFDS